MANLYELAVDEAFILEKEGVMFGKKTFSRAGTLTLTSQRLIWTLKGVMGGVSKQEQFALTRIKVHNGTAQAIYSKTKAGDSLQVFLLDCDVAFRFASGKRDAVRWADAINLAITGNGPGAGTGSTHAIRGAREVAETMRDTWSQFRGARRLPESDGGTRPTPAQSIPAAQPFFGSPVALNGAGAEASVSCWNCEAELTGTAGQLITCQRCHSRTTVPD